NQASTQTAVTGPSSSVFGQMDTFTATVTAVSPGAGVPTGTVIFAIDGVPQGSGVILNNGRALFLDNALAVSASAHQITATYGGDVDFFSSSSATISQSVALDKSAVTVSSSGPSVFGQPVTFTATVSAQAPGAGTPTGTVTFNIDGTNQPGPATVTGGIAT